MTEQEFRTEQRQLMELDLQNQNRTVTVPTMQEVSRRVEVMDLCRYRQTVLKSFHFRESNH